ncbi:Imidazolonepropionase [Cyclonatronum proteinivorum]|uniref:Imidazolonepropionase n=2 Tax=Cyclonatronum proteinivorum TaxID=1457365 RepID=A0A345UL50_9BACT|nr:Imidazolonepropionase [Cyclonatronum proteinivorum]
MSEIVKRTADNCRNTLYTACMAVVLFGLMAATPLFAQTPAPVQSQPVALTGGTIHTLEGDTIENGTIVFDNGIITAIGTDVSIPEGAVTEDVSGRHIYPGLIHAWSQIGLFEISAVEMTLDLNEVGPINPNLRAERAFHAASRHIGVARSAGITTSVSTPGSGWGSPLIAGQSAAMMMDGWTWEEMTLQAGLGMMVSWPNPGNTRNYTRQLEELREAFADARAYVTAVRAHAAGNAPRHDFDSRWHAMKPVLDGAMPVVVSANDMRQIQDAITWAQEEDIKLIILGGRDAHLVTEHLLAYDVPVLITTVQSSPSRWWEPYNAWYELPAQLHQAGVRFAIAGSSSAANANRLPFEAGTAAAFGLPADEALKSLTLYPAQIFGLDDRIGSLEVGKQADLLITTGNPIEYSTRVEQVYVAGRKSDMRDFQRQMYERYSEKIRQRQAHAD